MSTIILDTSSAEILRKCAGSAVLRDASGNVVGYFEPVPRIYQPGEVPEFDSAELDRREQRWEGIPSAEARRRLESLR
ncbi:MAG TPA: hypothetical protein VFB80_24210 [Pirellulaceae bacterium]|nr:hypothetical protein [Pirellulaceae bacterium]